MSEQVVSFIANKPDPAIPGGRTALKVIGYILGLPSAAAAIYVAFMNVGFLAGSAATPIGQASGFVGGVVSALGLSILLVAVGVCWKDMKPVAIMAGALFVLCLLISLSAMGSFTWVSSQPMRPGESATPRFDREPRRAASVERDIRAFLAEPFERPGVPGWTVVTNGREVLAKTNNCASFHYRWEAHACERWADLNAELAASRGAGGGQSDDISVPGSGATFTPGAIRFGNYFSATWSHLIIVAFASVGLAIVFGCAYVLMQAGIIPPPALDAPTTAINSKNPIGGAFAAWETECLEKDSGARTPAEIAFTHYRLWCRAKNWPTFGDVAAFGRKMCEDGGPLARRGAFDMKTGGKITYVGVRIIDDEFAAQIQDMPENGAG